MPGTSEGSLAMRVSFTRWTAVWVAGFCLSLGAAGGCQSGAGMGTWQWPTFGNWNWGNKPSTALAQSKPSTTATRPSTTASPQAVASVGAGTTGASSNYSTTTGTYPATPASYG